LSFNLTAFIRAEDMDFTSDIARIEAEEYEEARPTKWLARFWSWLI
jgi:hypothetical protein